MPKEPHLKPLKLYKASYFEAARRWGNRSILCVCEDFNIKADAKIAALDNFYNTMGLYFGTKAFIASQLARYATAQNEKAII